MATIEELQKQLDGIDEAINNTKARIDDLSKERFLIYKELEKERAKIEPAFIVKIFQESGSYETDIDRLKDCFSFIEKEMKAKEDIYYISIEINRIKK